MARRIRWQIVIAVVSSLLIIGLLTQLAFTTLAVSQPLTGGSYVEAVTSMPVQVVPPLNTPLSDPTGRDVGALLFDGLTRIGLDGLPEGALAEDWDIEQNGEVYLFYLRPNVTWHDGERFTADDVVFTIRSIQDEQFPGDPSLQVFWSNVQVDRIDDLTVRFTLTAPFAPFLAAARQPMMPAHLLQDIPLDQWATSNFAQQPVGTGPYRLNTWANEQIVLEANPDYYAGRPFIDRLELRSIESPQMAFSELVNAQVEALAFSTAAAPELGQVALPATVRRLTLPLDEYVILTFNMRAAPLADLAFRVALAQGLDKASLIEQVHGGQVARLDTPMLPGWWAYDEGIQWHTFDPLAAAQALEALGYNLNDEGVRVRDGQPLQLSLITDGDLGRIAAAEEVARQWGSLGVAVEIEPLDAATLRERLRTRDFTLAIHGWARLGPDPDVFELWHSSQAESGLNYAGLQDETIDEFLASGRTDQELAERIEDYRLFQQRWVELTPSITLYQPLYTFTTSDAVNGVGFEDALARRDIFFGREDRYRNITRWFINSSQEVRGTLR
ncbi:MAG: peptide ABC transporter substrate-binding protein [Chloroflexaceae bacterium]|nr:peptide ABC transporter substrate-binding protein [Chloroflexaceae bacterium]